MNKSGKWTRAKTRLALKGISEVGIVLGAQAFLLVN
ncbi:hypothetical protein QF002_000938 [Paraburkholderia youngii]